MNKKKEKEKEKKLNKAEEIKAEKSGVKLTDEELEQVTGGAPSKFALKDALDPKDELPVATTNLPKF